MNLSNRSFQDLDKTILYISHANNHIIYVEIQAQHRPDRLKKSRTESVGTDRIRRFCAENRDDARKDIPLGIYFGVSVGALKEH